MRFRPDKWLLGCVLAISALGAAVRLRMSGAEALQPGLAPLWLGLAAGVAAYFAFAHGRSGLLAKAKWPALALALAVLAAAFALGRSYRGGTYVAGGMNPTEPVKPLMVVFAAGILARAEEGKGKGGVTLRQVVLLACGFGAVALGLAALRDFGMLALVGLTGASVVFAASWRWGLAAFAAAAAAAAGAFLHPAGHLARRIAVWRDPFADPTGAGWQTLHGLAAMLAGGMFGEGFGRGSVEAIPIASSDFVYAALAEELGLAGCLALMALYVLMAVRGYLCAARAETPFQALLAAGLTSMVAVQVLVNAGGVVNAIPMTGVTLPLVSHGGSSLAVTLASCGLLLAVSDRPADPPPARRGASA